MRTALLVLLLLALSCGDSATGDGGSSGTGGGGGVAGSIGSGGSGGSGGVGGTGGVGGAGGLAGCQHSGNCDDGNECTENICNPADLTCSNPSMPNGTSCAAGSGQCVSGACVNLCELAECDDGNQCTSDGCNPDNGICMNPPLADGATCQVSGNPGRCMTGSCTGLCQGVDCSDGNQCTEDICATVSGSCSNPSRPDGASCAFGQLPGRCVSGVCEDAQLCAAVNCSDGNECTDDVCDPADASCSNPTRANDSACTIDGNPGRCSNGTCLGLCDGVICNDGNQCTIDACDPSDGSCKNSPKNSGEPCDLGENPGRCSNGICVGLCLGVDCNDENQCTSDTCDPSSGWCTHTDRPNGTTCDFDGLPGKCIAGDCTPSRSWGTPVRIGANNMADAINPQIAFDSFGNAIAIWNQGYPQSMTVGSNRFTPNDGWGKPTTIISPGTTPVSGMPHMALDKNGNALVVWAQDGKIWFSRFTPDGGWSTAARLDTGVAYLETRSGLEPQIAFYPDGHAMSIWHVGAEIWFNLFAMDDGWGQPDRALYLAASSQRPRLAVAPDGSAAAIWEWGTYSSVEYILANRYTPGDGWTAQQELERRAQWFNLEMAFNASGDAVAVFRTDLGLRAYRYSVIDGWVPLSAGLGGVNAGQPQVAIDPTGNAMAVWVELGSLGVFDVHAGWIPASGPGYAATIEFIHSGHANEPFVAMDAKGNALAVYRQNDGTRDNIWFNRFTSAGGWETAALLEYRDVDEVYRPRVAIDGDGNAIAVWEEWAADGSKTIWASRYE